MQLSPSIPRPADLRLAPSKPAFDLNRDATQLDTLPREVEQGINLPLTSTSMWGDDEWPIEEWYAAPSGSESSWQMKDSGIRSSLAGAEALSARTSQPVAVVQHGDEGARLLVPLGVWNPVDESELTFDDAGGMPHWNGADDHVLLDANDAGGDYDVEAVVFQDEGRSRWINLTGHPIRT